MAWHCVAKIKNDLNEFTFANFPLDKYNGPQGGSSPSDIGWTSYREQNSPGGTADFMRASAIADDLATQTDIPRLETGASYVKMVFGTLGGSAVDLRYVQTAHSGTQYGVDIQPYVYRSMSGTRMLVSSSSYDTSKDTNQTWTWGLAINEDTQEIYLIVIRAWIRWYYGIGVYAYYDRATASGIVIDQNPAYNLWDIFKDSIPSGGGGSNPYDDGGTSEPGGGEDQHFDEVSDTIDLPALPIYGATGSGFVTAFCPTVGQINDVADYLITPNVAQVIQGLFVKLSDVIIGLHLLPFVVNATNSKNIEIKNLAFSINTGVTSFYADNQYQRLDMGSVDVLKCWDNCLDYNPYTFVSIYLPFCGYFELDTDEVMGKTLHVVYDIDIITGSCIALIQVDGSVMYQFSGMCSCQIPITSVDFNQAVQSLIGLGASAAAGIKMIKGAASATQEAASRAMAPTNNLNRQVTYENYMEAKMNEQEVKESVASRLANASVNAVISGKGNYMHAGAVSSAPGFLACRKPFLIIKRPKQSVPEDYGSMRGFPSNMKATLGDLTGYTEVEDIHLNIPDATVDEIVECERLLKGGVYL